MFTKKGVKLNVNMKKITKTAWSYTLTSYSWREERWKYMLSTFTMTMFTCECWSWKATSSRLRSKVVMKELYCIALYSAGKYQCPDQLQFTESHSKQDPNLGFFSKTTDNNEQFPCEVLGAGIGFYHLHLWKILLVLMHLNNNNVEAVNDFGTYKILKWIFCVPAVIQYIS